MKIAAAYSPPVANPPGRWRDSLLRPPRPSVASWPAPRWEPTVRSTPPAADGRIWLAPRWELRQRPLRRGAHLARAPVGNFAPGNAGLRTLAKRAVTFGLALRFLPAVLRPRRAGRRLPARLCRFRPAYASTCERSSTSSQTGLPLRRPYRARSFTLRMIHRVRRLRRSVRAGPSETLRWPSGSLCQIVASQDLRSGLSSAPSPDLQPSTGGEPPCRRVLPHADVIHSPRELVRRLPTHTANQPRLIGGGPRVYWHHPETAVFGGMKNHAAVRISRTWPRTPEGVRGWSRPRLAHPRRSACRGWPPGETP